MIMLCCLNAIKDYSTTLLYPDYTLFGVEKFVDKIDYRIRKTQLKTTSLLTPCHRRSIEYANANGR